MKIKNEKGITIVGLVIIIAIIAALIIVMQWAVSFSDVVRERTKQQDSVDLMESAKSGNIKY